MPTRWEIERAVTHSKIPALARLVVLVLAMKSDNDTAIVRPEFTPALSTLAEMTGLARGSLAEWLHALDESGWVRRDRHAGKGSKTKRTGYALAIGTDSVVLRDRKLRVPREKKAEIESASAPELRCAKVREADTSEIPESPRGGHLKVREADYSEGSQSPRGGQLIVREADSNSPRGGHALTTPLPTGEGTTKNHHPACETNPGTEPAEQPTPPAMGNPIPEAPINAPAIPGPRWAEGARKPTTPVAVHGRTAALFPKPRVAAVETWMEIHQVIHRWLEANGYASFGLDEVQQIHKSLIAAHPGKGSRYLIAVIGNDGCTPYAMEIRKARNKKIADLVAGMQQALEQCEHGTPAGAHPHPTTGLLLCAQCRRGIPAPPQQDATDPNIQAVLTAYRSTRGNNILLGELLNITQQIEAFLAEGATLDQLIPLAESAGNQRVSLIQAAGAAV